MTYLLALLASLVLLAGCEKSAPQPPPAREHPAAPPPADATPLATEVQAAMTEFMAYSESILVIMREHGKDCDAAAKLLAAREPVFAALAPRLMKMKESVQALAPDEREKIKQGSQAAMDAFAARNPDVDAIEAAGKACEKSSPAFAEIAPKVMFVKKH